MTIVGGTMIEPDELVTAGEIARRLRLSRQRIVRELVRGEFPRPIGRLGRQSIWRWEDVAAWTVETGRSLPPGAGARSSADVAVGARR